MLTGRLYLQFNRQNAFVEAGMYCSGHDPKQLPHNWWNIWNLQFKHQLWQITDALAANNPHLGPRGSQAWGMSARVLQIQHIKCLRPLAITKNGWSPTATHGKPQRPAYRLSHTYTRSYTSRSWPRRMTRGDRTGPGRHTSYLLPQDGDLS